MKSKAVGPVTKRYSHDHEGRHGRKLSGASTTNCQYNGPDFYAEYPAAFTSPSALHAHGPNWDDPVMRIVGSGVPRRRRSTTTRTDSTQRLLQSAITKAARSTTTHLVQYSHDVLNQRSSVSDGRGAASLFYEFSSGGWLKRIGDGFNNQTNYQDDAVSQLAGIWAANNGTLSYGHGAGGRRVEKLAAPRGEHALREE